MSRVPPPPLAFPLAAPRLLHLTSRRFHFHFNLHFHNRPLPRDRRRGAASTRREGGIVSFVPELHTPHRFPRRRQPISLYPFANPPARKFLTAVAESEAAAYFQSDLDYRTPDHQIIRLSDRRRASYMEEFQFHASANPTTAPTVKNGQTRTSVPLDDLDARLDLSFAFLIHIASLSLFNYVIAFCYPPTYCSTSSRLSLLLHSRDSIAPSKFSLHTHR